MYHVELDAIALGVQRFQATGKSKGKRGGSKVESRLCFTIGKNRRIGQKHSLGESV